jgi:hypothetical protein
MDQSKKTMRHFYCRDVLWETFEQMANDFDCSIDYLINEAMRYYARSKNYQSSSVQISVQGNGGHGLMTPQHIPSTLPSAPLGAVVNKHGSVPPPRRPPPPPGGAAAKPPPPPSSPNIEQGSAEPTLYLLYGGNRYPIAKDQFIIGRGSKTSDLAIKDGNISRKHAAVIRRNGTFYIKDLGSTNGIDYKGMRIDNKRIDEGDVFHLCDYELRFTYRAD